ncbi:MAG: hypothetical protein R3Y11_08545 [Pseudomonadota bacterium]
MKTKQLLRQSYYGYGKDQQLLKTVEELNELATALMHYRRGHINAAEVAGELADVEIMCAKMRIMLGRALCKEVKKAKLKRLAQMFAKDKATATCDAIFKHIKSDELGE